MKFLQRITEILLSCSEHSWLLFLGEGGEPSNFPVINKSFIYFKSFVLAKASLASYTCCELFFVSDFFKKKQKHH